MKINEAIRQARTIEETKALRALGMAVRALQMINKGWLTLNHEIVTNALNFIKDCGFDVEEE